MDSSQYTTASLEKMYDALEAAKALYEDENAKQAAVDEAADALNAACDALVAVADKTELQNLIAQANKLKEADYTAETWDALQTALDAAVTVNDNHDASQEDVDNAADALQTAIGALEKAPTEEPGPGEDPDKPGTTPGEDPDKPGTTPGEDPDKPGTDSGKQDGDKAVQTGDNSRPAVWVTLMLAGVGGAAVAYGWKRKNKKA